MPLSRETTSNLAYWVDQITPPVIRDSRLFAKLFIDPFLGGREEVFHDFFGQMPLLSDDEYGDFYRDAGDTLVRETDLNKASIEKIVSRVTGPEVLDAACGKGALAKRLAEHHRVTAFDIATSLEPKDGLDVVVGSIESIPFPDRRFDTVTCTHALEHVIDFQATVRELRRLYRQRLILVVPLQRPYRFTPDLHVRFFPYPELFLMEVRPPKDRHRFEVIGRDLYYEEWRA